MNRRIGLALAVAFFVGCADGERSGVTGPQDPEAGSIEVSLTITGALADPDGCRIAVDDGSERIFQDGEIHTFAGVYTGTHVVTISDVSLSCVVHGERWRSVEVRPKQIVRVAFSVSCPAPVTDHIAFTSKRDGQYDIWLMANDGSNSVNLTKDAEGGLQPAWSPDGTQIAYTGSYQGVGGIIVMDSDGQGAHALTDDNGSWPTWSPQGDRIAYVRPTSRPEDAWRIYIVNVDGSNNVPLTDAPTAGEYEPAWSPDGRWIAYTGADIDIYLVAANGGPPVNLTNYPNHNDEPAWSPDGSRIAFRSYRNGVRGLYVMDADGSNVELVVPGTCLFKPTWSPDGTRIAYSGPCGADYEIFSVRVDGTGLIQLTDTDADDIDPAYSPGG